MAGGDAGHNTGMLIYNAHLMAPGCSGTLGHGDFRDTIVGGPLTSPKNNVNYSALTTGAGADNDRRDYYRAFLNNTTNDQASVTLVVYGNATLTPRTGAGAGSLGANKNVHIDVKIPGKTGWMDTAKAASGGISNGDGALAGDRDPVIDGAGASNVADFQTAFVAGTVSSGGPEHFIIRIVTSKYWTGYITRASLTW